nr:unnamed protein product [Spirometra erinaceieuropaei]
MLRPRPLRISEPDLEQAKNLGRKSSEQGVFVNCCGRDRRKTAEELTSQVGQPLPRALNLTSRSHSGLYDNIPPFSVRKSGYSDVLEGVRESLRTLVEQVYDDRAELLSLIQQKFAPYGRTGDAQRRLEAGVPEDLPLEDLPPSREPYARDSKVGVTPAESRKGMHVEDRIMKALGRGTLSPETVQKVKESLRSLIDDVQRGNVEVTSLLHRVLATNSDVAVRHESAPGRKNVEEVSKVVPAVSFPGQDKGLPFSSGQTGTRDRELPGLETPFVPSLVVNRASGVIIEDTPQRTDEGIGARGSRSVYAADSVEQRGVRYQENGTKIPSEEPNDKSSPGKCDISRLGQDIQSLMNEIRSGYQRIRVVVEEACHTDCQRLSPQLQTQTNGETATDSQNTNDFSKGEEAKSAKSLSEGMDRSYVGEETPGLTNQTPDKNSQAEIPEQECKWEDHPDTELHEQKCEITWEPKLTPLPPRTEVDARECLTTSDVEKPSATVTPMEDVSSKATVVRMSAKLSVSTDRRSVGSSTEAAFSPAYEQPPSADKIQSSDGSRRVSSKQVATMTELGEERASLKPSKISLMITTCSTKWQDTKQGILASLRGRGCSFLPAPSAGTSSAPTDTPDGSKDNSKEPEKYETVSAGSPVPSPSKVSAAKFGRGCNCLSHEASTRISTESEESVASRQETRENIFSDVPMPVSTDSEKGRESLGSMPDGVLDRNSISMARNPVRKSSSASGGGQALGMKASKNASLESEGRDLRLNQSSLEESPAVQMLLGDFNPSEALTTGTTVPSSVEESTENARTTSEIRPEQPDNEAEHQDTHQEGSEMPEELVQFRPGPPDDQVGQSRRSSSSLRESKETRAILASPIPYVIETETADLSPALDFDSDPAPSLSPDPVTSLGRTSRSSRSQSSPTELLAVRKSLEGRRVPSPSLLAPPGRSSIVLRESDATGKRFSIELTSQRSSWTSEGRSESRLQRLEPQPDGGSGMDELVGEKRADSLKAEAVLRHSTRSDRASQTGNLVGPVSSPSDGINTTTTTVSHPEHSITNGLSGNGPLPNSEMPTTTAEEEEDDDNDDDEGDGGREEEEEARKEAEPVRGSRSRPKVPRKKYSPRGSSKQLLPQPSISSSQSSACPGNFRQSEQAHTKIPRCRKVSTALPPACSEPQSLETPPVETQTARRLPRCPHRAPFRVRRTQDSQACETVEDERQDVCAPPSQRPRHPRKA